MTGPSPDLRAHFREAFRRSPVTAFRDWFRAEEELRDRGEAETARRLAEDLWDSLPDLIFDAPEARARFLHNVGVFFGSPGPAADLGRARFCFGAALDHFAGHAEDGWRARALHNLATALTNLGQSPLEIQEAVALFGEALSWRTAEREIARAVTLHHLGLARRRLAALDPSRAAAEHLPAAVEAFSEAAAIRERQGLAEGLAASRRELEQARILLKP